MSHKYKIYQSGGIYFVTYSVVYWIDFFIRDEYRQVLLDSWKYCQQNKGFKIYAWCIMTSHAHMIVSSPGDTLSNVLRDIKSYTSHIYHRMLTVGSMESRKAWILKMMKHAGGRSASHQGFQFWQPYSHPLLLDEAERAIQKLYYIHMNPVKAGFVDRPENYLYSSAVDYEGGKGLVEIQKLEL